MIHKRLIMSGTSEDKQLQEALFDRLWEDTLSRIRGQGLAELTVNSHLKNVQKYTLAAMMGFDHSQTFEESTEEETEAKRLDELGGELWRKVFMRNDKLPVDHVLRLAKYVRRERGMVMELDDELWREGRIPWGKVPGWKNVVSDDGEAYLDHETYEEALARQKAEIERSGGVFLDDVDLPEGWNLALTDAGKVYYWNQETRETRWEKPRAV